MAKMPRVEYDELVKDLAWLKANHPRRKTLINFVERFQTFVTEEHERLLSDAEEEEKVQEHRRPHRRLFGR